MSIPGDFAIKAYQTSLKVLIVKHLGSEESDLEIELIQSGYLVCGSVTSLADALRGISQHKVSIVLVECAPAGELKGAETLYQLRQQADIPVILVATETEEMKLRCMGLAEPFDYVIKPLAGRELRRIFSVAFHQHQVKTRLRGVERWLTGALSPVADGLIVTDSSRRITLMNPLAEAATGWASAEAVGKMLEEVLVLQNAEGADQTWASYKDVINEGVTIHVGEQRSLKAKNGRLLPVDDCMSPIRGSLGEITGCVIVFRDRMQSKPLLEEWKRLETKMQDTQRLESLGMLAAGIAHDFNNLLTVVTMNASLAKTQVGQAFPGMHGLDDIQEAAERAALLCNQMLAYAGQGTASQEEICVNALIRDTTHLLRPALSKKTALSLDLGDRMPKVRGDRSQLQQVIMNLVMNASEALLDLPGRIKLKTRYMQVGQESLSTGRTGNTLTEGEYLMIEIKDTGEGMIPEVLARIFDPFFTTKFTGHGLGLATVLSIVRNHGGDLTVESWSGAGTTFRIYIPPMLAEDSVIIETETPATSWLGSGYALIVDDETTIRNAAQAVLTHLGFEVQVAADGMRGLEKILRQEINYRVILLDLTMPHLDGHEVYKLVRESMPQLPIIVMSGYSSQKAVELMKDGGPTTFIQKPFSVNAIKEKLMALLG